MLNNFNELSTRISDVACVCMCVKAELKLMIMMIFVADNDCDDVYCEIEVKTRPFDDESTIRQTRPEAITAALQQKKARREQNKKKRQEKNDSVQQ